MKKDKIPYSENPLVKISMDLECQIYMRSWAPKMPKMSFDSDMDVVLWPPFAWVLVRMQVNWYSIYLDVENVLGFYWESWMEPYWELYDWNDTHRFDMEDTVWLLDMIRSLPKR